MIADSPNGIHFTEVAKEDWDAVRKSIYRAKAEYVAVKRQNGARIVLCSAEIKGFEHLDLGTAQSLLASAIAEIAPHTLQPIRASKIWEYKDVESHPSNYEIVATTTAPTAKIIETLRSHDVPVAEARGEYWERRDTEAWHAYIPKEWTDDDLRAIVEEAEGLPRGWAVDFPIPLPGPEEYRRRDAAVRAQTTLWAAAP